jgi:hypothetical protein
MRAVNQKDWRRRLFWLSHEGLNLDCVARGYNGYKRLLGKSFRASSAKPPYPSSEGRSLLKSLSSSAVY